jgi:hypothetical protein
MQLARMVLSRLMAPGEPTRMWGKCYAIWRLDGMSRPGIAKVNAVVIIDRKTLVCRRG